MSATPIPLELVGEMRDRLANLTPTASAISARALVTELYPEMMAARCRHLTLQQIAADVARSAAERGVIVSPMTIKAYYAAETRRRARAEKQGDGQ